MLACDCDHGFHYIRTCGHSGNCPCGPVELECSTCDGSGVRPCEWLHCGEPAEGLTPDCEALCRAHLIRDFDERLVSLRELEGRTE